MYIDVVTSSAEDSLPAARARLATVLRASREVVSIELVSQALKIPRRRAAELLSRWRSQGWIRRIGRGLYVPVPLDLAGNQQVVTDPCVLVPSLFGRSYIGGWTAAHHWELTEQLFNETVVFTPRRITKKKLTTQGIAFILRNVSTARLFGLKTLWRGSTKVSISDPARTLIDMIASPGIGGGIDHVSECLTAYSKSKDFDREVLVSYAERFNNGVVFKRLGFLSETVLHDRKLTDACRSRLTKGYSRLDPSLPSSRLSTAWKLWVPPHWKAQVGDR
jgi:predicted transcriptional regulator of viral defense system